MFAQTAVGVGALDDPFVEIRRRRQTKKIIAIQAFLREEGGPLAVEGACEALTFSLASLQLLD